MVGDRMHDVIGGKRNGMEALDPQTSVEAILLDAAKDPATSDAISNRAEFATLEDLAIHRSESLTLLAGALPAGLGLGSRP
jgi:hypothetical protein